MKGAHRLVYLLVGVDRSTRRRRLPGYMQRLTPEQRQAAVDKFNAVHVDPAQVRKRIAGITSAFERVWAEYWEHFRALTPELQSDQFVYLDAVLKQFSKTALEECLRTAPDNIRARYLGG